MVDHPRAMLDQRGSRPIPVGGDAGFFNQLAQGALGRIGFVRFEMAARAKPLLKLLVTGRRGLRCIAVQQQSWPDAIAILPASLLATRVVSSSCLVHVQEEARA